MILAADAAAKSLQLCLTLCDPIDSSPPGSPIPGILRARTLEWVAISFSSHIKLDAYKSPSIVPELWKMLNKYMLCYAMLCYAKSLQSCLTLCDPIDGSLPGSPVPGILQARTLEWVAISFCMHESEK